LAGVSASMRTPTGSPAGTLVTIADENKNTMIVIGTRGQSGLKRLVVGSVTDKVIRASGHPVLVVPPSD
jgi:nucleotide-binding universal stress UspA family protein